MYGETGALMRSELVALLRQHRVQQRLGGPGSAASARATRTEREAAGALIRAYRQTIMAWCAQAVQASKPLSFATTMAAPADPFRTAPEGGPVFELARALEYTRTTSTAPLATLDLLTTRQGGPVEHWRLGARAAALAEHDTSGAALASRLTAAQARALVGDAAAVVQALIVLDRRYARTPGWEGLAQPQRLGWAALACAMDVNVGDPAPDYTVDETGWRPRVKPIGGPARPGVLGVLQAEHNLLARLTAFPNATNLRLIVDSQRHLATTLARFADSVDRPLGQRWLARAEIYGALHHQLRDVGGRIGRGGAAVVEAANALNRVNELAADIVVEPRVLAAFQTLFERVDERIAQVIEDGIARGLFVTRVPALELGEDAMRLVRRPVERFGPAEAVRTQPLLHTVTSLRQVGSPGQPAEGRAGCGASRAGLHAALVHRPPTRRPASPPASPPARPNTEEARDVPQL